MFGMHRPHDADNIERSRATPQHIRDMTARRVKPRMPDDYLSKWVETRRRTSLASRVLARLFRRRR